MVTDQLHPVGGGDRTERFGYLGLTSLVTSEEQTPAAGSDVTKTYGYDAWGHRLTMSRTVGTGSPTRYTYGYDVHGSVSTLLDEGGSGTPSATYGYTTYGSADGALTAGDYDSSAPTEAHTNNPLNAYRYTAKRLDTGAGDQLDMGARRFAPSVGRFLQVDYFNGALADLSLSADPLTSNRYGLAGGTPLSFIEWDGHTVYPDGGGYVAPPQAPPSVSIDYDPSTGDPSTGADDAAVGTWTPPPPEDEGFLHTALDVVGFVPRDR